MNINKPYVAYYPCFAFDELYRISYPCVIQMLIISISYRQKDKRIVCFYIPIQRVGNRDCFRGAGDYSRHNVPTSVIKFNNSLAFDSASALLLSSVGLNLNTLTINNTQSSQYLCTQ